MPALKVASRNTRTLPMTFVLLLLLFTLNMYLRMEVFDRRFWPLESQNQWSIGFLSKSATQKSKMLPKLDSFKGNNEVIFSPHLCS